MEINSNNNNYNNNNKKVLMTSKNYIYVKKGKIGTNVQTISFLYFLMVWDGMELKIDDIVHFVSGFSNLTDLNS